MAVLSEGRHPAEFILSEANGRRSREVVTVKSGAALTANTVVGKITLGAASADFDGDGAGAMTLDATTPVLAGAMAGDYSVVCITEASGGGVFRVTSPLGVVLGDVAVGAAFANQIKFVIADGTPDFSAGDAFTVTVAEGSGKVVALAPAALDGSASAYGVLVYPAASADVDDHVAAIVRDAEVNAELLSWPAGITNGEKTVAIAALEARGVIVR